MYYFEYGTGVITPKLQTEDVKKCSPVCVNTRKRACDQIDKKIGLNQKKKLLAWEQQIEIQAMTNAKEIMSKSINEKHNCLRESWIVCTLRDICGSKEAKMKKQPFKFEQTKAACQWNAKVFKKHNYEYAAIVDKYRNSTLSPGSEFRPTTVLQNVFHYHKDWPLLREMLTKGISYPM